jgi:citrate synthase
MPATDPNSILNPSGNFAIGLYIGLFLGLVLLILLAYNYLRLKGELSRFRRHLSDKLEIEAETMKKIKTEQENTRQVNEALRIKVNALNELPDRKLQRDLEIYARAEKKMLIQVPGFAPAWETAKAEAHTEIVEEENGRSAPRRIFSRLFGGGGASASTAALPSSARADESGKNQDGDPSASRSASATVDTADRP